jgi:hypothetical protein
VRRRRRRSRRFLEYRLLTLKGDVEQDCLKRWKVRFPKHSSPCRCKLQVAFAFAENLACLRDMPKKEQGQEVRLVDNLVERKVFGLVKPWPYEPIIHLGHDIPWQTTDCRCFEAGSTAAAHIRISAFRVTAECRISFSLRSEASRIGPTDDDGGRDSVVKLAWSSSVHAGSILPSQLLTAGFCNMPGATTSEASAARG